MAVLAGNSPLQGMRGLVGGLVFRSYEGMTVVAEAPSAPPRSRKRTELQELYLSRFGDASRYATALTRDPVMKALYRKKAKKMKLSNAYTAAVAEYLRKTKVESIDTRRYTGKAGGSIAVVARKKDFVVDSVQVTITTKAGVEVEKGQAVQNSSEKWIYKSTTDTTAMEGCIITVDTKDKQGNTTHARHHPGYEPFCLYGWKT